MAADRQREVPPRRGRADDLDAFAVGSVGREQGTLAVDALVAEARDLRREAAEQDVVDTRRLVPRHAGDTGALGPHLARRG